VDLRNWRAVLLVVTADLDIQAPQVQTMLQTYLPFVLALPFVSLYSFLAEALRAANRTLGTVVTAYAVNLSMLLAVAFAPPDASLALYSWAFLLGSLVSAAAAVALARRAFPATRAESAQPVCHEVLEALDAREFIGLARGALLWGPLCILSVSARAVEMAQ
jgi:O-antigen/teichoic acid export membrane protein